MLKLITAPTVEPVTLTEVKEQTVIGFTTDDTLLTRLISVARAEAESITRRSLAPQTLEVVLDTWPRWEINLPRGPVTAVSSVKYYDEDAVEQTLSTSIYETDLDSIVARVQPRDGEEWPDLATMVNAVRVRYTAGWTAATCPVEIKQWILVRVASLYAQRENFLAGSNAPAVAMMPRSFADALLDSYTVLEV